MSGKYLVKSAALWVSNEGFGTAHRRYNVGVVDLLALNSSRVQQINQDKGDAGILIGDFKFGLELPNGLSERAGRRSRHDSTGPCGRGEEFAEEYLAARPEYRSVTFKFAQPSARRVIERRSGKTRIDQKFVSRKTALPGVGTIDVFATESHRGIRQTALQNGQRIHETAVSCRWLLGERLQYNRIAFAIRLESRVGGCPDQFCRHQNFTRVIDLDNHWNLLINDIRFRSY